MTTMVVKRGDIFYADLSPVIGSEQGGIRPVIIIQNDIGNKYSPTVIVSAITSQIKTRNRNNSITYRLNANSNKFANDLNNLGFGLKDDRTEIPIISESLIRHFIRGYFDGDGHIRKDSTFEGIDISGRIEFIDNLKIILKDYIVREELHSTHSKRIYTDKLKGIQFLDYIYQDATIYLTRKYTVALSVRNNWVIKFPKKFGRLSYKL